MMFVLGLTGSIGMGKSETAKMFRRLGVPVYDADAEVHKLLARGGEAVAAVEAAFPGVVKDGAVDRQALGARVFGKPDELRRLEAILHPRVGARQRRFLARHAARGTRLVVLDIPLLFEGNGEARCDATVCVSAPPGLQKWRVMRRPGMTEQKFHDIVARQVPDKVKRQRADYVVLTGLGRAESFRHVARITAECRAREGHVWPPRRRPRPRPFGHPSRRPVHARNRPRHRNHRT
jgi:dephospho-CoA kinase